MLKGITVLLHSFIQMTCGCCAQAQDKEQELHNRHKELIDSEMQKMLQLRRLLDTRTVTDLCNLHRRLPPKRVTLKLPRRYQHLERGGQVV